MTRSAPTRQRCARHDFVGSDPAVCFFCGAVRDDSYSHIFDDGSICRDANPLIWATGDDCLHAYPEPTR